MSRKRAWHLVGAVCLGVLLCCGSVPAGFWLYDRYANGSGPLRRDGGDGWGGRAEDGGHRFALGTLIRNHHDRPVLLDAARLDGLPPTGEPDSSGWIQGPTLLLVDFIFESPARPFPVELAPGEVTHVVVRFKVRCAPPSGADVSLILRATVDGQQWEERVGAPIDLPDHAKDLPPCD
ncbi:hypothetical protein [Allorhizocola rhizosphaerae]|uniref:hypothetical protein n=1 Tax=Allorhizocola rhizosphaerae TaxID=1872709 RepID=UPI000E3BB4BD|nr:hypothetical protein [Allorhizocola rhizosphaerae]